MTAAERLEFILIALGKASALFMSHPDGGQIVMPTEDLLDIASDVHLKWQNDVDELNREAKSLKGEIAALRARAERAERVAVWAAETGACGFLGLFSRVLEVHHMGEKRPYPHDDTDAGIFRALAEACEGGREGGMATNEEIEHLTARLVRAVQAIQVALAVMQTSAGKAGAAKILSDALVEVCEEGGGRDG